MSTFFQILGYLGAAFIGIAIIPEFFQVVITKKTAHLKYQLFGFLFLGSFFFVVSGIYDLCAIGFDPFTLAVVLANAAASTCDLTIVINKMINRHIAKKKKITEVEAANTRRKK